ncbi:hypothetical protein GVAV_002125 [Gurleya vavrai]
MDAIIEKIIITALSKAGYTTFSNHALSHFTQHFSQHTLSLLKSLASISYHAQRSKSSIVDFNTMLRLRKKKLKINDLNNFESFEFIESEFIQEKMFNNPIASNIDRFIHVYEFMPQFPPTHTFKRNYVKEVERHRKPDGIKKRIEETVLVERSLIKMLKERGEMPKYVNYLNKM